MKIHPHIWVSSGGIALGILLFTYEPTRLIAPFIIGFFLARMAIAMEKTRDSDGQE